MTITVKLFAILRDRAGVPEVTLDLPAGATVGTAAERLAERFPQVRDHAKHVAYAVNTEYVTRETVLNDGDELAVIPPVSGGADPDWIEITPDALDTAAAVRFVSDPEAGGVDLFLGTTRAETNPSGQALLALDYDAYVEMATRQLHELARRVREKWPVRRCVIHHRVGRVEVAQPSVLIAVSCPHRGEAFEACRWLIDELKRNVTIWKKEVWGDGSATWVHRA
jgi:molybdopterin synthase catalytic subunit